MQASFSPEERKLLHDIARQSIESGVSAGRPLDTSKLDVPNRFRAEVAATFVTLFTNESELRGCIGELEARQSIAESVASNAFKAAFEDPRFPPLEKSELKNVSIHLSVLSPLKAIQVSSEAELVERLRPGVDGVVIEDASTHRRGTFLPAVWEDLPDPKDFLMRLKQKAHLPASSWSPHYKVFLYTVEEF
jgi:AmmeMemoRadiSam system protein A